jgi:hypothetical protein
VLLIPIISRTAELVTQKEKRSNNGGGSRADSDQTNIKNSSCQEVPQQWSCGKTGLCCLTIKPTVVVAAIAGQGGQRQVLGKGELLVGSALGW